MQSISTEIFGQKKALNILHKFSQSGKIPHALLFNGSEGIGKYFTALEFVKFINSSVNKERNVIVDKKISNLSEPYVKYIMPLPRGKNETGDDSPTSKLTKEIMEEIRLEIKKKIENPYHKITIDKANIIKISSIRDINKFISFNYDDIKYRVIIIDNAHLMNPESQNALLKNLEEPPPGVLFILLTSAINRLLPTIISRCWQVNFEPLQKDEIRAVLIEHFKIDEIIAAKAALFSNGSLNTALLLIENDIEKLIDRTIFIIRYAAAKKYGSAYQELLKLLKVSPATRLPLIISMFIKWFDDAVKNKYNYNDYYFENNLEPIITFNSKFKHVNINLLIQKLDELQSMQARNVGLNLIAVNIILELASIRQR